MKLKSVPKTGGPKEISPKDVLATERQLAGAPTAQIPSDICFAANLSTYGKYKFKGDIANKYLMAQGLPAGLLDGIGWNSTAEWSLDWTSDKEQADKVARGIIEWAKDLDATVVSHLFQPLGSAGLRLGQTGQVHNTMFQFGPNGQVEYCFSGSELLQGETDGSSYMNGGMRATHTAGGYTALDPTSPIFIKGDTVYIPTVFVSWLGESLDEKTPLLKSMRAVSEAGQRLMGLLGWNIKGLQPNIGLEQEFFLIPREAYYKRPDLQLTGRTVMGAPPSRGQELCDHYMAPLNQVALACIKEMQHEGFKMGIPLKTRHREVAPNQYEMAPYFGVASTQIDENLMVMQLIEEIPPKYGLVGILHEKPFQGVNGSGKHNNFSLGTPDGVNLFNGPQVTAVSGQPDLFPVVMSAVVRALDTHGDLMRMSIASPGNDFRLGACEAPPAIISTYLGEELTTFLQDFKAGATGKTYAPEKKPVNLGIPGVATFHVPAEDRNRTSPFPYGGHRFEFRAAGSSQNVSMINTVLCTAIAESFAAFADEIAAGATPHAVASKALEDHWKVVFNGNGYSEEWPVEAAKRGVWRIDSGVEAMGRLSADKNLALWEKMGVMTRGEAEARTEVMYDQYSGVVEIEAKCMISMVTEHVAPSCTKAGMADAAKGVMQQVEKLQSALRAMEAAPTALEKATAARVLRLETMEEARTRCDEAEAQVPPEQWTLATYKELLFLDFNQGSSIPQIC